MNLAATKNITAQVSVVARMNEIQVKVGESVEYVWFCNNIEQARSRWTQAVYAARNLAARLAA